MTSLDEVRTCGYRLRLRNRVLSWAALSATLTCAGANAQLAINEIEYEQSGADRREFVELYEPEQTGMSLLGWRLVLYNGSQGTPYRTIDLSEVPGGVMPGDGYLVIGSSPLVPDVDIHIPGAWIQNGPPDGMALVHDTGTGDEVVELLSYEGDFWADASSNGGPAAGMYFPDVGVMEDATDCVGLMKIPGTGGVWTNIAESLASPGAACEFSLDDYATFLNCLAGPSTSTPEGCATQDWACDGMVDMRDFAVFQAVFPNQPCP